MNDKEVSTLIARRRRQILVHSYIYYELNTNIIDDSTYSRWSEELYQLQVMFPKISQDTVLYEEFKGWDYSTGYNLPYKQDWIVRVAKRLLK